MQGGVKLKHNVTVLGQYKKLKIRKVPGIIDVDIEEEKKKKGKVVIACKVK